MTTASQNGERVTLARQVRRTFIVFAGIIGVASLATATLYGISWFSHSPELERSHLAIRVAAAAHAAMLDQEDALRGYLLTRDRQFLEPLARGQAELARANEALVAQVGSVPYGELAVPMVRTRLAEKECQEHWAAVAGDSSSAAAIPSLYEGKAHFDKYRREQAVLSQTLTERRDHLHEREQRMTAARASFELFVFVMLCFLAVHQYRKLRSAIIDPVAALLRHVRRIRDGELEPTAHPTGPGELAELADGLNEMVGALGEARQIASSRDRALREHSKRLRQVLSASREFSESLNLRYVIGAVRASTTAVGGYEHVTVWLMDDERKRLVDSESDSKVSGDSDPPPGARDASVLIGQGLAAQAAKSGRVTFEGTAGEVRFAGGDTEPMQATAVPMVVGARVVGVLEARYASPREATAEVTDVLEMLATHAATAIESARLHRVVEERSQVDVLTQLLNRRRLDEDLGAECRRCSRYGRPMTLVMLDIDHFKAFNDSHGHPAADKALQEISNVILGCVRTTDTAYRYGGEEFCIILRETMGEHGMIFAERVRTRIERRFASGALSGITASLGVASFDADASTPRTLLEAADAAMYASKHAGRNRVTLSSRPPIDTTLANMGLTAHTAAAERSAIFAADERGGGQ